ncbi:MAG: hypothetical protein RL571_3489 [Pseudomonadota bacterium]|jgi:hypothetical protein
MFFYAIAEQTDCPYKKELRLDSKPLALLQYYNKPAYAKLLIISNKAMALKQPKGGLLLDIKPINLFLFKIKIKLINLKLISDINQINP